MPLALRIHRTNNINILMPPALENILLLLAKMLPLCLLLSLTVPVVYTLLTLHSIVRITHPTNAKI
jgi:hypothetical protein